MEVKAAPRRMQAADRREHLIDAALVVAARDGHERIAFEKVANEANVSRNLVYHYFPGGRQELLEAVAHRAGQQLLSDWVTDRDVPLAQRLETNLNRMIDHASEPTAAWVVYRQGRGGVDESLLAIAAGYRDQLIANISLNQLGTSSPPPVVRIALDGFLAFAETVVESGIELELERDQMMELVAGTLMSAMNAAAGAGLSRPG
jgi:AcrR family transcriptional regulator